MTSSLWHTGDRVRVVYVGGRTGVCVGVWCVCLWGGGVQAVIFLVVILANPNSCHGQLDAPIFYRKSWEVGIKPGEFLAFFRPPDN